LNFLDLVSKCTQISNFISFSPVGDKLLYVDGRTDGQREMTELRVAFRNFANASAKVKALRKADLLPSLKAIFSEICP